MEKTVSFLKTLAIAVLGAALVMVAQSATEGDTKPTSFSEEPVYDRVMQTKTIRCGWVNYQPAHYKDLATGEMRGIFVEAMADVGRQLGMQVEWTAETTWASFFEDMRAGKFDVFCGAAWMLQPGELTGGEYTSPLYYSQIGVYARSDDKRFDNQALSAFNSPAVTISGIDGSYAQLLATQRFPQAKVLTAAALSEYSMALVNVSQGKADVTFVEKWLAADFMAKNSGQLREVVLPAAVDIRPNAMMVAKGEFKLQSMLNYALFNTQLTGTMDAILTKHENQPGVFKRVSH